MGLKERVYSVLVVSQAERFNTAIKSEALTVCSSTLPCRMTRDCGFPCKAVQTGRP